MALLGQCLRTSVRRMELKCYGCADRKTSRPLPWSNAAHRARPRSPAQTLELDLPRDPFPAAPNSPQFEVDVLAETEDYSPCYPQLRPLALAGGQRVRTNVARRPIRWVSA